MIPVFDSVPNIDDQRKHECLHPNTPDRVPLPLDRFTKRPFRSPTQCIIVPVIWFTECQPVYVEAPHTHNAVVVEFIAASCSEIGRTSGCTNGLE